jgi:hypothetical protein
MSLDDEIPIAAAVDPANHVNGTASECAGGAITVDTKPDPAKPACKPLMIAAQVRRLDDSFVPIPPSAAIDNYDPKAWTGEQKVVFTFDPSKNVPWFDFITGVPLSQGWQKLTSTAASMTFTPSGTVPLGIVHAEGPSQYPLYGWQYSIPAGTSKATFKQTYELELSNQRVNPSLLRQVAWGQLDALDYLTYYNYYRQPEQIIESEDPAIAQFVDDTLGPYYRAEMTPYDAARTLFKAVLAHMTYYSPGPGDPDLRGHSAVDALEKGLADCGGYSYLIVAVMRHIGIPARTAEGIWAGGAPHVWAELYLPAYGWFVADGSVGDGQSPDGAFAYNFGFNNNLDNRMAFGRGNTFKLGEMYTITLQGPEWYHPKPDYLSSTATVDLVPLIKWP